MGRASRRKRDRKAARRSGAGGRSTRPAARAGRSGAEPAERKKLSDSISELIAPYRDEAPTLRACRDLVAIGCLAWNLSFVPEPDRSQQVEAAAREVGSSERRILREFVGSLISRKERLFPDDRRMIVSNELTPTEQGFHLLVGSTQVDS